MRVWIDLANSPHVATFEPVVHRLREHGHEMLLTARDHAQTVDLARSAFGEIRVVGGESPAGRIRKARSILARARALQGVVNLNRPDVALSHGSYAQLLAARAAHVPSVTMMDYEHQPANHLSFRLARRVIVPRVFPETSLRRFGARRDRVIRYEGFKEELYLGRLDDPPPPIEGLGLDAERVIVVLRPAPEGALYHPAGNEHFERILDRAAASDDVQAIVLPRGRDQRSRYVARRGVIVPDHAVDGRTLLRHADVMIGAGGTMNRESALLGIPTFTIFAGRLAAVDAELIRLGLLHDLRNAKHEIRLAKKGHRDRVVSRDRSDRILETVIEAVGSIAN